MNEPWVEQQQAIIRFLIAATPEEINYIHEFIVALKSSNIYKSEEPSRTVIYVFLAPKEG